MLEEFLVEFRRFNTNMEALLDILRDYRTLFADRLGWRVKDE